jgi:hypothetical protein
MDREVLDQVTEKRLNMGLFLQALKKTENFSLSTSVAHSKKVLPYY